MGAAAVSVAGGTGGTWTPGSRGVWGVMAIPGGGSGCCGNADGSCNGGNAGMSGGGAGICGSGGGVWGASMGGAIIDAGGPNCSGAAAGA